MAIGFRKRLFGFSPEDVVEYIEKSQKRFFEKERELAKENEELNAALKENENRYNAVCGERDSLAGKLDEFSEKYEEIERLSESIGKLYLVAQTNARALVENSEKNAGIAENEVRKNIAAIDGTHTSLNELKNSIISTSDEFIKEIDGLIESLSATKEQLEANTALCDGIRENLAEVLENSKARN